MSLAGIAAASSDSLAVLLGNNAQLAFDGKKITNQDHWENWSEPNDFPLVNRANHPFLWAAHASLLLLRLHHVPFDLSPPFFLMIERCFQTVFGCCVSNCPYLVSRKSGPSKTVLEYPDHILRWPMAGHAFACSSWMTSMNSTAT